MCHFDGSSYENAVFEINGALGARRAHFRGRAFFRTYVPDVRTIFSLNYHYNILEECIGKSRAHSFNMNTPEGRMK